MQQELETLKDWINHSDNIVFFGGAGVSTESGIPDFRSVDGLYNHRNYCQKCGAFYDARYMLESKGIPKCEKCGGIIKPDVVLYEEGLDDATMRGAIRAISHADVLIIGGTSLTVYPAAGLIDYYNGNKLVLINKSVTPMDSRADLLVQGPIGEIFSQL